MKTALLCVLCSRHWQQAHELFDTVEAVLAYNPDVFGFFMPPLLCGAWISRLCSIAAVLQQAVFVSACSLCFVMH